ncbi:unnamed protein product [Closterium sp. NIES-65]|nr:unnamed protein product [Closterium sp. NIES-65]
MSRHAPSPAIHAGTPSRVAVGMGGLTRLQPPRDLRLQRGSRGLRSARYAELATSFLPRQLATPLRRLPVPLQRAHSSPSGERSSARACSRTAWNVSRQADRRMSVACRAAESGDVAPADWVNTAGTHKRPQQVFYSKKVPFPGAFSRCLFQALMSCHPCTTPHIPIPTIPHLLHRPSPLSRTHPPLNLPTPPPPSPPPLTLAILMAFDDVSVPLPPMRRPDLRQLILEEAERDCVAAGITDIRFVCSIALHRFVRPDEFRHICGGYLYGKYYPQRMGNYNAVDMHETVDIGVTRHGEAVQVRGDGGGEGGGGVREAHSSSCSVLVSTCYPSAAVAALFSLSLPLRCAVLWHGTAARRNDVAWQINRHFAEADLVVYANVNYVSMDGGYKSYATGLVSSCCAHTWPG